MEIFSWLNSLIEWVMKHVYPFPIFDYTIYTLLSVILYFICSTLTSMSFIYFVISILLSRFVYCLRIFLLNTINISMFSLYIHELPISHHEQQTTINFFFLYSFFFLFSLLSSQEVIYILLLDGLELTLHSWLPILL